LSLGLLGTTIISKLHAESHRTKKSARVSGGRLHVPSHLKVKNLLHPVSPRAGGVATWQVLAACGAAVGFWCWADAGVSVALEAFSSFASGPKKSKAMSAGHMTGRVLRAVSRGASALRAKRPRGCRGTPSLACAAIARARVVLSLAASYQRAIWAGGQIEGSREGDLALFTAKSSRTSHCLCD